MSSRPTALFIARLLTNPHKDSFLAHLGSSVILGKFNIAGYWARPFGFAIRCGIGFIVETGVFHIDLTMDAIKEGLKKEEFKKDALNAYKKATAKVYTEEEKARIRKEYLAIISGIGNVGNPK
jgi:hypothetical protein